MITADYVIEMLTNFQSDLLKATIAKGIKPQELEWLNRDIDAIHQLVRDIGEIKGDGDQEMTKEDMDKLWSSPNRYSLIQAAFKKERDEQMAKAEVFLERARKAELVMNRGSEPSTGPSIHS